MKRRFKTGVVDAFALDIELELEKPVDERRAAFIEQRRKDKQEAEAMTPDEVWDKYGWKEED